MTLKIISVTLQKEAIEKYGLKELLTDVNSVEILNAYQYDDDSLFSLQRISFKPQRIADFDKIFKEKLTTEYYEILNHHNEEILCILKQRRDTGFFRLLGPGPAALIFPLIVREDGIHCHILAEEQYLTNIYETLSKITESWKINNISKIERLKDFDQFDPLQMLTPNFTARQRDIVAYAAQNGYFKSPKQISGKKIAEHFGISVSAVNMHLKKAEDIAINFFFGIT